MTAKEKAKELVMRFEHLVSTWDCYNDEPLKLKHKMNSMKKCALICVDVILNDVGAKDWELDTGTNTNYWEEVKKEINKL